MPVGVASSAAGVVLPLPGLHVLPTIEGGHLTNSGIFRRLLHRYERAGKERCGEKNNYFWAETSSNMLLLRIYTSSHLPRSLQASPA